MPLYNTLGNHDHFGLGKESGVDPEHPEYGKKMFTTRQAKSRYYSFDHEGWHFMVLDSVRLIEGGGYRGGIDAGQMAWITDELEEGFLMVRIKGDSIDCEYIDYGWEAVTEEE
jgi:Icc protein